jgi:GR25 family glycosyltransferase involved in LPS biosynthesis
LLDFSNSVKLANNAYQSAKFYNWDVEFFEGTNGQKETLKDYNIKINTAYKKSIRAFERVGTVGCFLSHYKLWQKCIELNQPICILEHDVTIHAPFPKIDFDEVYKFCIGPKAKPIYIGEWWASGAGYCITTTGAQKLISFTNNFGAMPADVMLNTGVVDMKFDYTETVTYCTDSFSFTWDL